MSCLEVLDYYCPERSIAYLVYASLNQLTPRCNGIMIKNSSSHRETRSAELGVDDVRVFMPLVNTDPHLQSKISKMSSDVGGRVGY